MALTTPRDVWEWLRAHDDTPFVGDLLVIHLARLDWETGKPSGQPSEAYLVFRVSKPLSDALFRLIEEYLGIQSGLPPASVIEAMARSGSEFERLLAKAYLKADDERKRRLFREFPEHFMKFLGGGESAGGGGEGERSP